VCVSHSWYAHHPNIIMYTCYQQGQLLYFRPSWSIRYLIVSQLQTTAARLISAARKSDRITQRSGRSTHAGANRKNQIPLVCRGLPMRPWHFANIIWLSIQLACSIEGRRCLRSTMHFGLSCFRNSLQNSRRSFFSCCNCSNWNTRPTAVCQTILFAQRLSAPSQDWTVS